MRARTVGQARIEIRCEQALPAGSHGNGGGLPLWREAEAAHLSSDRRTITVSTRKPARTLVDIVRWIDQSGIELADVQLKRPSLEDVFLELTGKSLRE